MTKKYTIIARDFNSHLTRNYIFTSAFGQYPELLGIPKLILFPFCEKGNLYYFTDLKSWQVCHDALKEKIIKDPAYLEELIDRFLRLGEEYSDWAKRNIFEVDLDGMANEELMKFYLEFYKKQSVLYALGVVIPVLDFQQFSFVEGNLTRILKEKITPEKFQEYYDVFTTPTEFSFSQEQEVHLLTMVSKYNTGEFIHDLIHKEFDEFCSLYKDFCEALEKHTKKYAWVYYVYAGPAYTAKNFFEFIRQDLHQGIEPVQKLQSMKDEQQKIKHVKKMYIKELRLNNFETYIVKMAGKIVWAKPRRKDYQSQIYYYIEKMQKVFAKRLHLSLKQVRFFTPEMIRKGLQYDDDLFDLANQIFEMHVCLLKEDGRVDVKWGQEAQAFKNKYFNKEEEHTPKNEFVGQVAFTGYVRGKIKIINTVDDMQKMKDGDILVSVATTPAIVLAMKKAGAILTDEGGLTCHASIVSRELKKPCIVGFKDITNYLQDGDKVEVDAIKGIVKKIT